MLAQVQVHSEMPIRHLSGDVKQTVGQTRSGLEREAENGHHKRHLMPGTSWGQLERTKEGMGLSWGSDTRRAGGKTAGKAAEKPGACEVLGAEGVHLGEQKIPPSKGNKAKVAAMSLGEPVVSMQKRLSPAMFPAPV